MSAASTPERRGLLVVYTGHGKGKTTAALGMVFRALGRGLAVTVVQFIKGKWKTGERVFAEQLPALEFHVMGLGFTWDSADLGRDKAAARAAWETAREAIQSGKRDLIVLDELTYTFHYDFLSLGEVLDVLRARPPHVHVVVTKDAALRPRRGRRSRERDGEGEASLRRMASRPRSGSTSDGYGVPRRRRHREWRRQDDGDARARACLSGARAPRGSLQVRARLPRPHVPRARAGSPVAQPRRVDDGTRRGAHCDVRSPRAAPTSRSSRG